MADWMAANVHALLGIKGIEIRDYGSKVMSGFKKGALVKCGAWRRVADLVPCF